jgi:hypothetical protein
MEGTTGLETSKELLVVKTSYVFVAVFPGLQRAGIPLIMF